MEERPRTPSVVSFPLRACARSTWRFSHADLAPCGARQGQVHAARCLKARIATRTPFRSGTCLYMRLCRAASPRAFPASSWLHPKLSSFSEPTAARVSATTTCFELVRPPATCLAARCGAQTRCVRPTSASHCFDYEYPYLVSYRHLFEARASPLAGEPALATRRPVDLAFHDARSASAGSSGSRSAYFLRALLIEPYL
jgi:hypothetical protein